MTEAMLEEACALAMTLRLLGHKITPMPEGATKAAVDSVDYCYSPFFYEIWVRFRCDTGLWTLFCKVPKDPTSFALMEHPQWVALLKYGKELEGTV